MHTISVSISILSSQLILFLPSIDIDSILSISFFFTFPGTIITSFSIHILSFHPILPPIFIFSVFIILFAIFFFNGIYISSCLSISFNLFQIKLFFSIFISILSLSIIFFLLNINLSFSIFNFILSLFILFTLFHIKLSLFIFNSIISLSIIFSFLFLISSKLFFSIS